MNINRWKNIYVRAEIIFMLIIYDFALISTWLAIVVTLNKYIVLLIRAVVAMSSEGGDTIMPTVATIQRNLHGCHCAKNHFIMLLGDHIVYKNFLLLIFFVFLSQKYFPHLKTTYAHIVRGTFYFYCSKSKLFSSYSLVYVHFITLLAFTLCIYQGSQLNLCITYTY